ncbi:MAG: ABC transporter ATP-binding protein [Coxiellaceae bacterium]|nr:ABC transporter ATP-binding protein [Coxiellaceae bacterium]
MQLPKTLPTFIWHFIKKQRWYLLTIQLLAFAWALDNTVWPYFLKMLINKMTMYSGAKTDIWPYLLPMLIFWASVFLLIELAYRFYGFMLAKAFPRIEAHIRMAMFEYVEGHSYSYFANRFAGNISNRISDMCQSVSRLMQLIMTLLAPVFIAFVIASIIFYVINPWFALLLIGWSVLHIGICFLGARKCANLSEQHSNARSFLTGKIVDSLTNIINVKLFARKRYECDYVYRFQKDEREKNIASLTIAEKIKIGLGISAFIFPGVFMTWYVIHCWQLNIIGIGSLVLIFTTVWNIQSLAWHAGLELPNLYKEIGTCQQALALIRDEHAIKDKEGATALIVKHGEIRFNHVTFNYHKGSSVFNDLSVTIEAGSKVGLVGFSGGGKSTFVNLIMRFFDIESGEIQIDGNNISEVTLDSLRSQISMIPQDPTLFHRSLSENIRYGKINATDEEVIAAAKHAHCHEFITNLPQGYDSLVGERGHKLSDGQRQRIAIARAILENAPILILDEATSALDSITERRIQDALHYLMKNRTTLVIAHRLSTLSEMDHILVFHEGKVIEAGNHEALLKANGHYKKLWDMQAGGFLPDAPGEE